MHSRAGVDGRYDIRRLCPWRQSYCSSSGPTDNGERHAAMSAVRTEGSPTSSVEDPTLPISLYLTPSASSSSCSPSGGSPNSPNLHQPSLKSQVPRNPQKEKPVEKGKRKLFAKKRTWTALTTPHIQVSSKSKVHVNVHVHFQLQGPEFRSFVRSFVRLSSLQPCHTRRPPCHYYHRLPTSHFPIPTIQSASSASSASSS